MRLQDIAIVTNTLLDTDRVLLDQFRSHDSIQRDPKTSKRRTSMNIPSGIRHPSSRRSGAKLTNVGASLCVQAIEELEMEGEVLVMRTLKDGQLRVVFWNEIKPEEDSGGLPNVEKEFRNLWHSRKVPNHVDLLQQASEGLQATTAEAPVPKAPTTKKKRKRSAPRQRQVRITNMHLKGEIDLLRNYTTPGN